MPLDNAEITLVVDNAAEEGLGAEHGLAIWIETPGRRILFDTGQGPALPANADRLGIDLAKADTLVLSHGHYDHTGGVTRVLQGNPEIDVYCHPCAVQPRYSICFGAVNPIHMPQGTMAAMDKLSGRRMHWVTGSVCIGDDIGLTGPIPRKSSFEEVDGPFFLDPLGRRKDPIQDDTALWINTSKGLVVCAGCCHSGLINTLRHVRHLSGVSKIRAVIGGFHLTGAGPDRIARTLSEMEKFDPGSIVACHCTGKKATAAFRTAFNGRVTNGRAGLRLHFKS